MLTQMVVYFVGLSRWLSGEGSTCNAREKAGVATWTPGSGRSPGAGNGNSLQYPCLENLMDRGAWWAVVHGVAESGMTYLLKCLILFGHLRLRAINE